MINKKVFRKMIMILFLIAIIAVMFVQIRKTAARYASKASTENEVDVAFYVMDNSFKDDTQLVLEDILPSDTPYEYTFTVSNNNGTSRTETSMEYDVTIIATTNMPIIYTVEKNGEECTLQESLITDTYGTYYKKILIEATQNDLMFTHTEDITDEFIIKAKFPLEYSQEGDYADLIENVRLEVEGRQIIEE